MAENFNLDMATGIQDRGPQRVDLAEAPIPGREVVDAKLDHYKGNEAILEEMLHRVNGARDWWRQNHENARSDVDFAYNKQWPEEILADRDNRPSLQFNLLPQYINQVDGQVKMSKFNLHVIQTSGPNDHVPVWAGGPSTVQSTLYPASEVMEGLIRDIEQRSKAERAYCRALQHAVEGGFGWLFVRTMRPDDNPFEIEVRIEHVKDRWSVLMDEFCRLDDFSDARWGMVSEIMPRREFMAKYPGAGDTGWSVGSSYSQEYMQWWSTTDSTRVAHYFWKEPERRTIVKLVNSQGWEIIEYEDRLEPVMDELEAIGYQVVDEMPIDSFRMMHAMTTAHEILEGPNEWPGCRVPLVPVIGREINLDGYNYYAGLVRYAWDPQRMFNYFISSSIERVALSPKAPWLATAEQISGHESDWHDQHKRQIGVLLYNQVEGLDKPERQQPATMPTAEMNIVLYMRQAVMETIGMTEASLGKKSNETSGVAIARRQNTSQANTYSFVDNLAYAIASVGDILCDLVPKIYSADAMKRIIMPDESTARVQLNHEIEDRETGKRFRIATLNLSRYLCRVKPGPAFSSVREEFVRMMTEWGRSDPEGFTAVRDLIVNNLDVPFSRELARRYKMLVPKWMLRPEDQADLPEPPPPEPTPEQQAEMAKAEATVAKAESDKVIAQAEAETSVRIEELKLQQEQEKTRQQELRTEQAGAALEGQVEKDAAAIDKTEREAERDADAAAREQEGRMDEQEIVRLVRREIADAAAAMRGK